MRAKQPLPAKFTLVIRLLANRGNAIYRDPTYRGCTVYVSDICGIPMILEMREFCLIQKMDLIAVLNLVIIRATSQILPILNIS